MELKNINALANVSSFEIKPAQTGTELANGLKAMEGAANGIQYAQARYMKMSLPNFESVEDMCEALTKAGWDITPVRYSQYTAAEAFREYVGGNGETLAYTAARECGQMPEDFWPIARDAYQQEVAVRGTMRAKVGSALNRARKYAEKAKKESKIKISAVALLQEAAVPHTNAIQVEEPMMVEELEKDGQTVSLPFPIPCPEGRTVRRDFYVTDWAKTAEDLKPDAPAKKGKEEAETPDPSEAVAAMEASTDEKLKALAANLATIAEDADPTEIVDWLEVQLETYTNEEANA